LIQEADSALYAAKRSGGNTIIVSDLISRETGEPNRLTQEGKV